jgi:hypothetical protein
MDARDLMPDIVESLALGERADDIEVMIDLLAEARATALSTRHDDEVGIAAKIICIIFDPLKPPTYVREAKRARLRFAGIATDSRLRRAYVAGLEPAAMVGDLRTVIAMGRFVLVPPAPLSVSKIPSIVGRVASAYDIDVEKLARLFVALYRVLQRRLELWPDDAERLLRAVFLRCLDERERIINPHGWLLETTFAVAERGRRIPSPIASPSLEDLLREEDDDERSLGLEFE